LAGYIKPDRILVARILQVAEKGCEIEKKAGETAWATTTGYAAASALRYRRHTKITGQTIAT
jgi:hypothetical protein